MRRVQASLHIEQSGHDQFLTQEQLHRPRIREWERVRLGIAVPVHRRSLHNICRVHLATSVFSNVDERNGIKCKGTELREGNLRA